MFNRYLKVSLSVLFVLSFVCPAVFAENTLIDSMNTTDGWQAYFDEGAKIDISLTEGKENNAIVMAYNLDKGAWCGMWKELKFDLSEKRGIKFLVHTETTNNTFEIKIEDSDGSTFGKHIDLRTPSSYWNEIEVPFSELSHWWGGDDSLDLKSVKLNFAVSKRKGSHGGGGRIVIDEVVILAGAPVKKKEVSKIKHIKVAMCQIMVLDNDRKGNLERIENAVVEAKNNGAEVVCFPEMSILGWLNPEAHKRACPIPGNDSEQLARFAKKYSVIMCVGLAEKENNNLYNSALLISEEGRILHRHRKLNILSNLMEPPYTAGADIKVVNTSVGRVGVLICADTFIENNLNKISALKPDMLIVPYGWVAKEDEWPKHGDALYNVVKNASRLAKTFVIGINSVGVVTNGPWSGNYYGGESVAVNRYGKIIGKCRGSDREIKIVNVEIDTN